ncbi:hypothetical protein BT93_B1868 [Corymbia citriodora subsp. variegata]|nr:hypothetical protein BT93_B1868 [Corymbia citriodora subsp. variegata]
MDGRVRGSLPFVGMTTVVLVQASNMVVTKMAMDEGNDKCILAFCSNALSTLVLLPCPFIISRRSGSCPPLTFSVLRNMFLIALIGMEKVNWKSASSQAELVGSIASILGAFIVTFYKGPSIFPQPSPPLSVPPRHHNWIFGGFLLVAEAFLTSLSYIGQAFILKDYPVVLNLMFYSMFFSTILSGLLSFVIVREEPRLWIPKVNIGLTAILYSALVDGVFKATLCMWCLKKTGPVYVSMFKPLGIVFAVGLGFKILREKLHLGSLIGAVVIVMGFCGVVWGKAKEEEEKTIEGSSRVGESLASSGDKIPLLQSRGSSV